MNPGFPGPCLGQLAWRVRRQPFHPVSGRVLPPLPSAPTPALQLDPRNTSSPTQRHDATMCDGGTGGAHRLLRRGSPTTRSRERAVASPGTDVPGRVSALAGPPMRRGLTPTPRPPPPSPIADQGCCVRGNTHLPSPATPPRALCAVYRPDPPPAAAAAGVLAAPVWLVT